MQHIEEEAFCNTGCPDTVGCPAANGAKECLHKTAYLRLWQDCAPKVVLGVWLVAVSADQDHFAWSVRAETIQFVLVKPDTLSQSWSKESAKQCQEWHDQKHKPNDLQLKIKRASTLHASTIKTKRKAPNLTGSKTHSILNLESFLKACQCNKVQQAKTAIESFHKPWKGVSLEERSASSCH